MQEEWSNTLGFFETPDWVAEKIAKELFASDFGRIIDLGAGKGSLLKAVRQARPWVSLVSVEVNKDYHPLLKALGAHTHCIDVLRTPLTRLFNQYRTRKGLTVVSNPPYGKMDAASDLLKLLKSTDLISKRSTPVTTRREVVFIARALQSADDGTRMAFIVPFTLLSSAHWELLRETLCSQHALSKVMLLPSNAFPQTEVRTAVLFFTKNGAEEKNIEFICLDSRMSIFKYLRPQEVVSGLNIGQLIPSGSASKLGDYPVAFSRGKSSAKILRDKRLPHVHSSDLRREHGAQLTLPESKRLNQMGEYVASPGDILVARVGSRCLASAAIIKSGQTAISDCVISIRVPSFIRKRVFESLISKKGQEWLKSTASGSCARILTYSSLQGIPL